MSKKLKVAIIGCGAVTPSHLESYQRNAEVELVSLCDLVPERAQALAAKYNISRISDNYLEIIADPNIDCLSICTDHLSHAPLTIAALKAGKHVLCEKPVANTVAAIREVLATIKTHPELTFSGVFQHRFDAAIKHLKKMVEEQLFGTILSCGVQVRCNRGPHYYEERDWRGTWEKEGGSVTINQALHSIDSLIWIMGGVESVCGVFTNHILNEVIETEDTAVAAVRFQSGSLGTIEATASSNISWENTLFFHGSKGALELREGKPLKVTFCDPKKEKQIKEDFANCYDPELIAAGKRYYGKTHPAQINDFIAAIREKRAPVVDAISASHTAEVVLALYQSQQTGRWIKINNQEIN